MCEHQQKAARAKVYWIDGPEPLPGRLGVLPRPDGGERLRGEIAGLRQEGVSVLVSLLAPEEVEEWNLQEEPAVCKDHGLGFVHFPISDRGIPEMNSETVAFIRSLSDRLAQGEAIVVHCRMGIGRSSLMAASILVCRGVGVDEAFGMIAEARGGPVPDTPAQYRWVTEFAKAAALER